VVFRASALYRTNPVIRLGVRIAIRVSKENCDRADVATVTGKPQRGCPVFASAAGHVSATLQEHRHGWGVAAERRRVERGGARGMVASFLVGAPRNEELDALAVVGFTREAQRSSAEVVARIHVLAHGRHAEKFVEVALCRRPRKGRRVYDKRAFDFRKWCNAVLSVVVCLGLFLSLPADAWGAGGKSPRLAPLLERMEIDSSSPR